MSIWLFGRHLGRHLGILSRDKFENCFIVFLDLRNIIFDTKHVIVAILGAEICPFKYQAAILTAILILERLGHFSDVYHRKYFSPHFSENFDILLNMPSRSAHGNEFFDISPPTIYYISWLLNKIWVFVVDLLQFLLRISGPCTIL